MTVYSTSTINKRINTTGHREFKEDGAMNKSGPNGARGYIYPRGKIKIT